MPLAPITERIVKPTRSRGQSLRLIFLDVIRAVAAPLVMYDHIIAFWREHNVNPSGVVGINDWLRFPLKVEQDFGYFGVALFFLVSGFVVTHRATKEKAWEFALKRALRVYPVLIVVVGFVCLPGIRERVLGGALVDHLDLGTIIANITTANYLLIPEVVLVGVAWTLSIELMFYLLVLLVMPLLKRWVWAALSVEIAFCWAVIAFARDFGPNFFLAATQLALVPVLLLGQICWAVWNGKIPLWAAGLFGLANWLVFSWVGVRDMGRPDDGYGNTTMLALLIFILLLLAEPRLKPNKVVSFLADRSYSIYLWHGVIAFPLMSVLLVYVPGIVGTLVAVLATMLTVELSFRYIERPAQKLARRLTRRRAPARRVAST